MEHAISIGTTTPTGEHHPPWADGETKYGPETPGAFNAALKTYEESRAGGGLIDHDRMGGGERLVTDRLYAAHDPKTGKRPQLTTMSKESRQYVERVRPVLDIKTLSPSELRVWRALEDGHSVEWIARNSNPKLRRESVERIKKKLEQGGLGKAAT